MKETGFNREQDLRKQHEEFTASNDTDHNRRSGFTTMGDLRKRRTRRSWNDKSISTV